LCPSKTVRAPTYKERVIDSCGQKNWQPLETFLTNNRSAMLLSIINSARYTIICCCKLACLTLGDVLTWLLKDTPTATLTLTQIN
jgi:hypothetical protein